MIGDKLLTDDEFVTFIKKLDDIRLHMECEDQEPTLNQWNSEGAPDHIKQQSSDRIESTLLQQNFYWLLPKEMQPKQRGRTRQNTDGQYDQQTVEELRKRNRRPPMRVGGYSRETLDEAVNKLLSSDACGDRPFTAQEQDELKASVERVIREIHAVRGRQNGLA